VLGVLPGTIGTLQATEALNLLLRVGDPLIGKLMLYNALDMSFDFITRKKNPNCRVCGPNADVK
jgi:adenylyltransferase/sulfurtransferase